LFAVIFYTLHEPFLNETADSPRRRSLTLASRQKFSLHFLIARDQFFLPKGKENFFAGFRS